MEEFFRLLKTRIPSHEKLQLSLIYVPETGEFIQRGSCKYIKGTRPKGGRVYITIDEIRYGAHDLAWLWMTGEWPTTAIEHINGDPSDNRWQNLRLTTRPKHQLKGGYGKSGIKGVSQVGNRYRATANIHGLAVYLGTFNTADEAKAAYVRAADAISDGERSREKLKAIACPELNAGSGQKVRANLSQMSEAEKAAHKKKLARERKARQRAKEKTKKEDEEADEYAAMKARAIF